MTTPDAAAVDLDRIRADLRPLWAGGYPNTPGWPAQAAQDILALLAEVKRLRARVADLEAERLDLIDDDGGDDAA